ncbi:hypothetical protein ABID26_002095 [Mesorhizobium shonense]|uniref:Uncharacterized protein n=1 Tax=Mesorhizobium shonense TaxID=1209948 RepID=A0ABV2HQ29_9HYPH
MPEIEVAQGDLSGRPRARQSDCLLRTVDRQNEAMADTASDSTGGNAGTATDLQDAKSGLQWESFDESGYPLGDSGSHEISYAIRLVSHASETALSQLSWTPRRVRC